MQKMQKIQKWREFNGLADIGRPAENMQKMPKFTTEATAVHASPQSREAPARCLTRGMQSRALQYERTGGKGANLEPV